MVGTVGCQDTPPSAAHSLTGIYDDASGGRHEGWTFLLHHQQHGMHQQAEQSRDTQDRVVLLSIFYCVLPQRTGNSAWKYSPNKND
eukprot:3429206-Amphidinium_carterae.1